MMIPATLFILNRPWYDFGLLLYIGLVFLMLALRIGRESRMGWSLTHLFLGCASLFLFAVFLNAPANPNPLPVTPVAALLRLWVAFGLTWVVYEVEFAQGRWRS